MKRNLVLTNEAARHPFRQILPRPRLIPEGRRPLADRELFLLTFVAAFVAFFGYLA